MSCNKHEMSYICGQGLTDELKIAEYETKKVTAELVDRVEAVKAMPDPEAKKSAAAAVYEAVQALPMGSERTQDPTEPQKIVQWCPILLSPYSYELPEDADKRIAAAKAAIAALPCAKVFDAALKFALAHTEDFTYEQVLEYLKENPEQCSCSQKLAVKNYAAGIAADKTGCYMNPLRINADALVIGAAFGIRFAAKPELAARAAMIYSGVSHFKGGVYAAMWMAAMAAHAIAISDPEVYTVRSLSCCPVPTPFFRAVAFMQRNLNCRVTRDDCVADIHNYCDGSVDVVASSAYTASMVISAALLYSNSDIDKALETVKMCGYNEPLNRALTLLVLAMSGADISKYLA